MDLLDVVTSALFFIAPAYVANAAPLILSPLLKVRHPVDFKLVLPNGARLFGDAKSWEGLLVGIVMGSVTGLVLGNSLRGLVLGTGAMLGDLAGSFVKRRLGLMPGQPLPIVDQLDFLIGALALGTFFNYTLSPPEVIVLVLVTPPIHLASNAVAYCLRLKDRPY
ncbi:MAG: CDP-2,3-bis-(O-geranylgeranyl)-sn-glycerol synthase [Candidatus Nezhaarchaeota archaeon]|nr:CDP-2,3-bis-(O-geranylgeranyl)-sn-glycerol synthase [Candidatus Nezhaarchaeota archaeon]